MLKKNSFVHILVKFHKPEAILPLPKWKFTSLTHRASGLFGDISSEFQEYLTLDGEVIRVFMHDGRKKDVICPEEKMNRMLHAAPLNMYIGWIHAYHEIFVSGVTVKPLM